MHELYCPSCNTPSQFNFADHLLLCPFCSSTFGLDLETGQKDVYGEHYIIPNTIDAGTVKHLSVEWLKRLHHKPGLAEKEFFITDIRGLSIPLWVISMEGHTVWKGLVQKFHRHTSQSSVGLRGGDYLIESGQFRRSYRWAISARTNICETWGFTRLHEPQENVQVEWDGFPLDSTFSRGRLTDEESKPAYDVRKYFEFKFSNGLPVLGIQTSEEEALRRAKTHVDHYHYKLASLNVDYLLDHRTELEIAGIQLIHAPFWEVKYVFKPKTSLKHFFKPKEKKILIDGYGKGVLTGELAILHSDKVIINSIICGVATLLFLLLGNAWHPAFFLVALFAGIIALSSVYLGLARKAKANEEDLKKMSQSAGVQAAPEKAEMTA